MPHTQSAFIEIPVFARGPQLASRHVGIPGFEQAQPDDPTEQASKDEPADEGTVLPAEWFE